MQPRAAGQREVADAAQERGGNEHVPGALVESQLPGQQARAHRQLGSLSVQDRVMRGNRLSENAHGAAVRVAQLVLQPAVVECGAGVIAERQQQLVADLLEAPGAIGAHDHPIEAVAQKDGDGDEGVDLAVRRSGLGVAGSTRLVVTQDLVPREHCAREALRDGAMRWIVLEALGEDDVEGAVRVVVLMRYQQALFSLDEPDRRLQDQRADISVVPALLACSWHRLHALDLVAQLTTPFALSLP